MGNFISNQRIETMDGVDNAAWTERGVLMDVTLEKNNGQTTIKTAQAHPTWVNRTPKGTTSPEGYPLYTYQTYILEDFIKGGKYRNKLDEETKERIDIAYKDIAKIWRYFSLSTSYQQIYPQLWKSLLIVLNVDFSRF